MFLLAPFYLFLGTATAVKFYGHALSDEAYTNTMNRLAEPLHDQDISYGSIFMSNDLASKNGSDFLQELGIHDTTLEEFHIHGKEISMSTMSASTIPPTLRIMKSPTPVSSTSAIPLNRFAARKSADQLNCQAGAVEDQFSQKQRNSICYLVAGLVGAKATAVG